MVPFLLLTPAHSAAPHFLRGSMSDGCETTDRRCVVLSLALIPVVWFLGGLVQRALVSLSIGNGLSRRRTSQHTHTTTIGGGDVGVTPNVLRLVQED